MRTGDLWLHITCPEPTCAAPAGEECHDLRSTRGLRSFHPHATRQRLAREQLLPRQLALFDPTSLPSREAIAHE